MVPGVQTQRGEMHTVIRDAGAVPDAVGVQQLDIVAAVGIHVLVLRLLGGRVRELRVGLTGLCITYTGRTGYAGQFFAALAGPAAGLAFAFFAARLGREWESGFCCLSAGISALTALAVWYMSENIGYVSFLAMEESERGKTLGIQLLGYAVSYYRKKQRDRLRLSVSCENEAALRFFEKYGFSRLSGPAPEENRIVLERSIAVK